MVDFSNLKNFDFAIMNITPYFLYYIDSEEVFIEKRINNGLVFLSNCSAEYYNENGLVFIAPEQSIIFLPKNSSYKVIYKVSTSSSKRDYIVNFDLVGNEFGNSFPCLISNKITNVIYSMLNTILPSETNKNILELNASFYNILNDIYTKKDTVDTMLKPAMDFINSYPKFNEINIKTLAKQCNMHESTFRRRFESIFGVSPYRYICNDFINRANHYLITKQLNVSDVSEILGFDDIAHFSKFYKRYTGISPKKAKNKYFLKS